MSGLEHKPLTNRTGRRHPRTNDKIDALWTPDAPLRACGGWWRAAIRLHRTRIKNEVHSILHAHLIPKCPHADLFNGCGRDWLKRQPVPEDEQIAIERHIRELDRLGEDLAVLDRQIAEDTMDDSAVRCCSRPPASTFNDGCHRRYQPLQEPAEAGQLLRPQSACWPVRTWRCASRTHQKNWP